MNNSNQLKSFRISPKHILWIGYGLCAILLGLLVWLYYAELRNATATFWSNKFLNYIILVPAIGAAIAGTLLTRQFGKGESPHRIWRAFSIGIWFWVAGELSGLAYDALGVEALSPDFHLVDVFWLLGYFFLGLSLYYQILLVYGIRSKKSIFLFLGTIVAAFLLTIGLTNLTIKSGGGEGDSWAFLFVTILYPVLDLIEGATAIWLALLFRRGQWSRPWWGLILFALTDSIDAFYWSGGYDLIPVMAQSTLDFISLVTYPASYMVAGLALLSNYFLLRYAEDSGLLKPVKNMELDIKK
jgi:hypothetical protein